MPDSDEVLKYLQLAKERVEGGALDLPPGTDAVRSTRDHLAAALPHAHGGAILPEQTRLRPLKQAVLGAVRSIPANQAPFNTSVLRAIDGAAAAIEDLAHRVDLTDQHATRLQAGVATTELTVDDLVDDVRALRAQVAALTDQVAQLTRTEVGADADTDLRPPGDPG